MHLSFARLVGIGPFADVAFPFCLEDKSARLVTVVHGGGGVGKTALLAAVAATRPGHAVVQPASKGDTAPHAICHWILGDDDPERPHALQVMTPSVKLEGLDEEHLALLRREQMLFDKRARRGGFVFLALPSTRWFSRQPIALNAPARTVARYDVRTTASLEDASRADLARETKQALAYAAITSALSERDERTHLLGSAMKAAVNTVVQLAGFVYRGLEPRSLEPVFTSAGGRAVAFDGLPTRARHLVAFAALPTRTLWAAYPGRDPRASEGVVAIDEVDLHQDPGVQANLVTALRAALPRVQWILTTTSPTVAASCDGREVLALRRLPHDERIELFIGSEARTH